MHHSDGTMQRISNSPPFTHHRHSSHVHPNASLTSAPVGTKLVLMFSLFLICLFEIFVFIPWKYIWRDFKDCQFLILLYLFCCQELFYEDRHYHEHCFRCFRCDRSLADEPFTSQEDALLCNDCYCNEFSSKCVACDKIVMPGKGSEQLCLERFKCWHWRLFPSVPLYFCFSEVRESWRGRIQLFQP